MNPYLKAAAGGLAVVVPLYLVERATEYYFLNHMPEYAFFSSFRLTFFVAYIAAASWGVGRSSGNLRLTWAACFASLLGLYALLYVGCDPKACYSTGIDGLEPLRPFSFFLAEGMALSGAAYAARHRPSVSEVLMTDVMAFYAIAYYPVIFSFAEVKLVSPLSPIPLLLMLGLVSFMVSARVHEATSDRWKGVALPTATFIALAVISFGITAQYQAYAALLFLGLLAYVSSICLAGSLAPSAWKAGVHKIANSRTVTALLVVFVLLSVFVIPPDAVNGTAPDLSTGSYRFLTPVVAGGFNPSPNTGAEGVSANFTFKGTDPSAIQTDNFLAAGIGIHSPNCCVDGIDFGYRADVFLYHNTTEVFAASAWEICDTIIACGGQTWKHLMFFSSTRIASNTSEAFQLSIRWENRTAYWSYASGNETETLASFHAPAQENAAFDVGWLGPSAAPSPGGFPFFQFGIMSAYPIGHSGWSVGVSCTSILSGSRWECLDHVELFQGDVSYWKALWRWGENYPGVGATIDLAQKTAIFQYSQQPTRDFQTAW